MSNHSQTAHLWASGNRSSGKSGPLYFEGPVIYSYGEHYPIARFASLGPGRPIVCLFNSESSTQTTEGKHKNAVRRAIDPAWDTFVVPEVDFTFEARPFNRAAHLANWEHLRNRVGGLIAQAGRSRSYGEMILKQAETARLACNRYAELFPQLRRAALGPIDELTIEKIKAAQARESAQARKEKARKLKARQLAMAQALEAWRAGGPRADLSRYSAYDRVQDMPIALRICPSDDRLIESSLDAQLSALLARKVSPLVRALGASADDALKARILPFRIGDFMLTSVTSNHVVLGCHTITWAEIDRLFISQGWSIETMGPEDLEARAAQVDVESEAHNVG